jgi:hypothetical protein
MPVPDAVEQQHSTADLLPGDDPETGVPFESTASD